MADGNISNPIVSVPILSSSESVVPSSSAVALTTTVVTNITNISLGAGRWCLSGVGQFTGNPTVTGIQQLSINTVSATHGVLGNNSISSVLVTSLFTIGDSGIQIPCYFLDLAETTTVYLVASGIFSVGSLSVYGKLNAFRIS